MILQRINALEKNENQHKPTESIVHVIPACKLLLVRFLSIWNSFCGLTVLFVRVSVSVRVECFWLHFTCVCLVKCVFRQIPPVGWGIRIQPTIALVRVVRGD